MGGMNITCTAQNPRPSTCLDINGAVDLDVTVTIPSATPGLSDESVLGEVTLAPAQYDGRLAPYGTSADQWCSGGLLARLRAACESATGAAPGGHPRDPQSVLAAANAWFRAALDEISSAAIEAAS